MSDPFTAVREYIDDVTAVFDQVEIMNETTDQEMSAALIDWEERKVKEVEVERGVPKLYMRLAPEGRAVDVQELGFGVYHKYDRRSQQNYQPNAYLVIPKDNVPREVTRWRRKMGEQYPDVNPQKEI